tara:strand:- start:2656 stop:2817 length:162 start_codon:yes stop_codon:yes gene_type:complete
MTEQLKSYYQGRVLANDNAMNDPIVVAVLDDLALRNFEPLPQPEGTWNISDYD